MNNNATELYITVKRADLIDTMTAKRTETEKAYDDEIKKLRDEIAALPKTSEAIKDYYVKVGEMLAAGEIRVNSKGDLIAIADVEVPDKPSTSTQRRDKRQIEHEIDNTEANKGHALASLDASIRLLNLATDPEVRIPVSQYEQMLAGQPGRRRYY